MQDEEAKVGRDPNKIQKREDVLGGDQTTDATVMGCVAR